MNVISMLEIQKARIYERSRLRAKGATESEIAQAQNQPFKPAFVNGQRRKREAEPADGLPAWQFAFRRQG
jgi:hypothetical protein